MKMEPLLSAATAYGKLMLLSEKSVDVPSVPPDETPENRTTDPLVLLWEGCSSMVTQMLSLGSIVKPKSSDSRPEPKPAELIGVPCGLKALSRPLKSATHTLP